MGSQTLGGNGQNFGNVNITHQISGSGTLDGDRLSFVAKVGQDPILLKMVLDKIDTIIKYLAFVIVASVAVFMAMSFIFGKGPLNLIDEWTKEPEAPKVSSFQSTADIERRIQEILAGIENKKTKAELEATNKELAELKREYDRIRTNDTLSRQMAIPQPMGGFSAANTDTLVAGGSVEAVGGGA